MGRLDALREGRCRCTVMQICETLQLLLLVVWATTSLGHANPYPTTPATIDCAQRYMQHPREGSVPCTKICHPRLTRPEAIEFCTRNCPRFYEECGYAPTPQPQTQLWPRVEPIASSPSLTRRADVSSTSAAPNVIVTSPEPGVTSPEPVVCSLAELLQCKYFWCIVGLAGVICAAVIIGGVCCWKRKCGMGHKKRPARHAQETSQAAGEIDEAAQQQLMA